MRHIQTLIAEGRGDDRARLISLVENEADLELVGACAAGDEAVRMLEARRPDLAILAADLPGKGGFEVLKAGPPLRRPSAIFVTDSDQRALEAFEADAADCLRRPFTDRRFRQALQKARTQIRTGRILALSDDLSALIDRLGEQGAVATGTSYLRRVAIREQGRIVFLGVENIDWIEAADNYVRLHTEDSAPLLRTTMNELEDQLDPEHFARVHRSHIVNLDRVREARPQGSGDCVLVLADGTRLPSSRTYGERRRQALNLTM